MRRTALILAKFNIYSAFSFALALKFAKSSSMKFFT